MTQEVLTTLTNQSYSAKAMKSDRWIMLSLGLSGKFVVVVCSVLFYYSLSVSSFIKLTKVATSLELVLDDGFTEIDVEAHWQSN